jgi:hypothetical protein
MRAKPKTKEDKIAEKITNLLNDVTLDLEEVGKVIAEGHLTLSYNRLVTVAESAIEQKERTYERQFDTLF